MSSEFPSTLAQKSEGTHAPLDKPRGAAVKAKVYAQPATSPSREIDWERVEQYLPLARATAARLRMYFPGEVTIDDLSSIALNGLIAATVQFSPDKGKSFGRYAEIRIRGALLDELRKMDRFTRGQRSRQKRIEAVIQDLQSRFKRNPSEEEVADALEVPVSTYRSWLEQCRPIQLVSLDSTPKTHDDQDNNLQDVLEDVNRIDSREIAEKHEMVDLIRQELKALPDPHRKVLSLYHYKELNLAEIAQVMGITESRVCQIHNEGILSLKATLNRLHGLNN